MIAVFALPENSTGNSKEYASAATQILIVE